MNIHRIARLISSLHSSHLDAVVLNPSPSLTYMTGLHFHTSERPIVAIFTPDHDPIIVLPELETAKLAAINAPLQSFPYGENPMTWPEVFRQAIKAAGLDGKVIGIEPTRLRFLELNLLQEAAPKSQFRTAEIILAALRMQKDTEEIQTMRDAVKVAQKALLETIPLIKIGMTERELAAELTMNLLRNGSEPELPFSPIVSSGPNSANPHASPSDRKMQPGDLLVIDWGAGVNNYQSDLTRTFAIGDVEPEFAKIARITAEANEAGRNISRPGIQAGDVDRAARQVIEKAGYGEYFFHRVGHGLGMEGHEHPYMFSENTLVLQPGMTFTVEPGIYLTDRGGVRVEDDVVVTDTGAESLSNLPRELKVVG